MDGSGIGVDVLSTSSLNLQAGTIHDGALLHVRSNEIRFNGFK